LRRRAQGRSVSDVAVDAALDAAWKAMEETNIVRMAIDDFAMFYRGLKPGGALYFTALIDGAIADYIERDPTLPGPLSTYRHGFLF